MDSQTGLPLGFEFVDIEIINHKKQNEVKNEKWHCDSCSLFFLSEEKLALHKKTHLKKEDVVNCKYCDKILTGEEGKECYSNRKCETCEYRCSQCPQRFLRQSSLTNHEKNHSVKKRRITSAATSKKQVDEDGGQINDVPKKRRYTRVNLEDSSTNTDLDSSKLVSSPRRKRKRELDEPNSEKIVAATKKTLSLSLSNRRTSRRSLPDKDLPVNESVNSTSPIAPTNGSAIENTVTYKPFSCHVCGENFASDSVLLSHIKTHGETAAKAFKCKYCGDKFSDIYKMQYHLAICPLAEDELESSLVKSCPPKTSPKKPISGSPRLTNGDSLSRKRGKPRKYMDSDSCDENEESTTPNRTRSSISKRKSDAVNLSSTKVTNSSSSGKMNRSARGARGTSEVVGNATEDEGEGGTQDPLKITSGLDDENKRKMHQCPHPSCELKFTREKAMLCHYRNHEDYDGTVKCFKCGIPFDDDQDLSAHIKECKGIKEEKDDDYSDPLDTSQNDDIYYDEEDLHGVTKNIRGNYMCKICGKTYMTNDGLDRHMELHRSSNFTCRICECVFDKQVELEMHYKVEHPTKTPHHCELCGEDFMTEMFLTKHIRERHKSANRASDSTTRPVDNTQPMADPDNESSDLQYRIKLLRGFNYSSVSKIMSKCARNNQFWCACCCGNFNSKSVLRDHFKSDHILETNSTYVCQICEVEKPTIEMMCAHLEVHSLNLLTVNRFSALRGACTKPRTTGDSIVNVFPNLASMKSDDNPSEEVVDVVKQKLSRKYKIGSEVKFKQSRQYVNYNKYKNNPEKLNIKSEWMRNNKDLSYIQSAKKINEVNESVDELQTPLISESVSTKTRRSKGALPHQGSKRRPRTKREDEVKDKHEDKLNSERDNSTYIDQSYTGSMNDSDLDEDDPPAIPQPSSVSEPVIRTRRSKVPARSRRQRVTKRASPPTKAKLVDKVNDERANVTNIDVSNEGLTNYRDSEEDLPVMPQASSSADESEMNGCSREPVTVNEEDEVKNTVVNGGITSNINTNVEKFNDDLISDSEDPSPGIRENVELLLKTLSNDIADDHDEIECAPSNDCMDEMKSQIDLVDSKSLVVDDPNIDKSENSKSDDCYSNSSLDAKEEPTTASSPISPTKKLIKITKVHSLKHVHDNQIIVSNNPNQANISGETVDLKTDENPAIEKTDAVCCTMCSMPFYNQDELLDHVATHIYHACVGCLRKKTISWIKHRCNLCQAEFENELEENNHMIIHARAHKGFPCSQCFQICPTQKALQIHIKVVKHNGDGNRILNDLLNSLTTFERIENRLQNNLSIKYKTNIASVKDTKVKNSNVKENKWYFTCTTCGKEFDSKSSILEHEKLHLISCQLCGETFDYEECLEDHVKENHLGKLENFRCKICHEKKENEIELTDHIVQHAKALYPDTDNCRVLDSIPPFEINLQNKNTTGINKLAPSPESIHSRPSYYRVLKEIRLTCPICPKSFSKNSHLKSHVFQKHVNEFNNMCDKIEYSPKDIVDHVLNHEASECDIIITEKKALSMNNVKCDMSSPNSVNSSYDNGLIIKEENCSTTTDNIYKTSPNNSFYELTNDNITVCGLASEVCEISVEDNVDKKLSELPMKGAICTVCSQKLKTRDELKSHKNVLVYC